VNEPIKFTRGERSCNPGNIREYPGDPTAWLGERTSDDDAEFEEFNTPEDGIRALGKVLLSYQRKYGIRTIRGIINRWAPTNENDTESYIKSVCSRVGVDSRDVIDITDFDTLKKVTVAIIHHENGRVIYPDEIINEGVKRALA
jgi:hypothetical protein